jgi:ATP-binding cassette subfamily G (WHITE) protein 1
LRLKTDRWENAVNLALDVLELRKVEFNKIGTDLEKGISGGEKKRTSVALELLTGPKLLFLDEPTTGLDSHSALMLINTLRRLMDTGVTVICTIHQPNSFIFMNF